VLSGAGDYGSPRFGVGHEREHSPPMKITLFPSLTADCRTATTKTLDWERMKAIFQHLYDPKVEKKEHVPLFFPGTFKEGAKERTDKNVSLVYFAVLDYDGISPADFEELLSRVDRDQLSSIVYTTWSNQTSYERSKLYKLRLVVPFNRGVEPEEWPIVWAELAHRYSNLPGGSVADTACKNVGHIYYLPYVDSDPEYRDDDFVLINDGAKLNVDDMKDQAATRAPAAKPQEEPVPVGITMDRLTPLIKKLKKSKNDLHAQVAGWLQRVVEDKPLNFAQGEKHNSWRLLTQIIAEEFSKYPAKSLFQSFLARALARENQEAMPDDPDTVGGASDVIRLISGAQSKHQERLEEERRKAQDETLQRCKNLGLEGPYTEEQVEKYASNLSLTVEEMRRHLIFQVGQTYYVFMAGRYRSITKEEAPVALVQLLLPAQEVFNLQLHKVDNKGNYTRRMPADLVEEYGQSGYTVQPQTNAQQYTIDRKTSTLYAPLFAHDKWEPVHSEFVEGWLDAMCADLPQEKRLWLDRWLGWSTDLTQALTMLLVTGPSGSGKSLIANALATYWGRPCASAEIAFDNFAGEDLCESPIIFADEYFPSDKTHKMRSLLSAATHRLNRKYQQVATIQGHYRLIATANNEDILTGMRNQALTVDDLTAVARRIFHIETSEKAVTYLEDAGTARISDMLHTGEFARHLEYLRKKVRFADAGRFGTKPDRQMLDRISVSSGVPSMLIRWVINYLTRGGGPADQVKKSNRINNIRVIKGRFLFTMKGITEYWKDYMDEPIPSFDAISKGVDSISYTHRRGTLRKPETPSGPDEYASLIPYRELRMDLLEHWLESYDSYVDPREVYDALAEDTKTPRDVKRENERRRPR
jgi:hypothetical protein